ncbi:MAG: YdiU family protein [Clostridium sp.]
MIDFGFKFNNSYIGLPKIFYTKQSPTPVNSPKLVVMNYTLAKELGLNADALRSEAGIDILAGNSIPSGVKPIAKAYGGHQFGHFTILGDGRNILLGEQITPKGERIDIELKGSGRTPYSRGGDGRAALGPMLREYIISEAMAGLGIPTTRSLAVVTTGEKVVRDEYFEGAILTRIALSHIRVGTFEFAVARGTLEDVKALADYTVDRLFTDGDKRENKYIYLLNEVAKGQAKLIAKWQLVGFVHGVMNTDNMTVSGETIDYGPCAFMDNYDPATVFSSIDRQGRYAYGNQPNIGGWNLARFAETLLPLLDDNQEKAIEIAKAAISNYYKVFEDEWYSGMRKKLGLFNLEEKDKYLIEALLSIMNKYKADYTNTFRALTKGSIEETGLVGIEDFDLWFNLWSERLKRQGKSKEEVTSLMRENNPAVIPRNHRVEEALTAAVTEGDFGVMDRLLEVLKKPYAYTKDQDEYALIPEMKGMYRTFCGT